MTGEQRIRTKRMNKKKNTEGNVKYGETLNTKKGFTAEAICAIGKKSRSLDRKMEARVSLQRRQKIQKNNRVEQHCVSKKFQFF